MGSSSSSSTPSRYHFDPSPWTPVGEGDNYTILRNNSTGEEIEEYVHTATDIREFEHLKKLFEYRVDKDYLVSSKFFRHEDREEMCSTFFQGYIYTERIPLRMNQIKDLPYQDSLHLVNSALRGFRQLYAMTGGVRVNYKMIGVNSDAQVKVWMSDDFGRDRPDSEGTLIDERVMVSEVLEIIDKIVDRRTEPESITQALVRNGAPTFDEALGLLNEYTMRHVVSIPPCLVSIAELRDRGFFKKMPPKGRSSGYSINYPLEPSVNRNLPGISRTNITSTNGQFYNEEITGVNSEVPIPIPPPFTYTANQPNLAQTGMYEAPILSPLSIPMSSSAPQQFSGKTRLYNNELINRTPLTANTMGVPSRALNHLHYNGTQPVMGLSERYPPPPGYSPLQPPPPHINGHKTEVRSWMLPPINLETPTAVASSPLALSFGPSSIQPIAPTVNTTGIYPQIYNNVPTTVYPAVVPRAANPYPQNYYNPVPTTITTPPPINNPNQSYYPPSPTHNPLSVFPPSYTSQPINPQQISLNYQTDTNNLGSGKKMIVIPDKIQLTLTNVSSNQPFDTRTETFTITPNASNIHSGLIKEIIQHTVQLQNSLKEGAFNNPTVIDTYYNDTEYDVRKLSPASTTSRSQFDSPRKDYYNPTDGGYTDPALLLAMKTISSVIDNPVSHFDFSFEPKNTNIDHYTSAYKAPHDYLHPIDTQRAFDTYTSYNDKSAINTFSQFQHTPFKDDTSSPQIMAIISSVMDTGLIEAQRMRAQASHISDVESVNYDNLLISALKN